MTRFFSYAARTGAYLVTLLLAAVWTVGALDTLLHPLYDLGRHNVGDVIIRLTGALGLSPHMTFQFAHLLAGLKLMVGALLLTALVGAIYEKVRWGSSDDALLDVALFTAQPIHEIAYDLAFSDPSHFARFFRKQTGTTPHEFREGRGG